MKTKFEYLGNVRVRRRKFRRSRKPDVNSPLTLAILPSKERLKGTGSSKVSGHLLQGTNNSHLDASELKEKAEGVFQLNLIKVRK